MIDIQALAGDSTDNVPGVPGIGVKTAAQLIDEYGDLDTLLERAGEIKQPKRRQNLQEHADLARISRELVTLKRDVPVEDGIADFLISEPEAEPWSRFWNQTISRHSPPRRGHALAEKRPLPMLLRGTRHHLPKLNMSWSPRCRHWKPGSNGSRREGS